MGYFVFAQLDYCDSVLAEKSTACGLFKMPIFGSLPEL